MIEGRFSFLARPGKLQREMSAIYSTARFTRASTDLNPAGTSGSGLSSLHKCLCHCTGQSGLSACRRRRSIKRLCYSEHVVHEGSLQELQELSLTVRRKVPMYPSTLAGSTVPIQITIMERIGTASPRSHRFSERRLEQNVVKRVMTEHINI